AASTRRRSRSRSWSATSRGTPVPSRPPRRRRKRMRFDRRLLTHFEWFLPLVAICVSALGILTVYSASYVPGADTPAPMAMRQLVWCVAGLGAMLAMLSFDYRRLGRQAYLL